MIVDFHTHILPCIDDGSASVEESLELLRMEAQQGVRHVVATPHFYPHSDDPQLFLEKRRRAETLLREAAEKEPNLPKISIGAEVYYFHGISDSDILPSLAIDDGRYILIEMPSSPWTKNMYRELANIPVKQGLTPIIAHIDRYITPLQKHNIPNQLSKLPVLVQANASFFLRYTTRPMALRMLKKGQIHLLGSDCHNIAVRPPNLASAVQVICRRLGSRAIDWIQDCEYQVL